MLLGICSLDLQIDLLLLLFLTPIAQLLRVTGSSHDTTLQEKSNSTSGSHSSKAGGLCVDADACTCVCKQRLKSNYCKIYQLIDKKGQNGVTTKSISKAIHL